MVSIVSGGSRQSAREVNVICSQYLVLISSLEGAKVYSQTEWEAMAGFPPLDPPPTGSATVHRYSDIERHRHSENECQATHSTFCRIKLKAQQCMHKTKIECATFNVGGSQATDKL